MRFFKVPFIIPIIFPWALWRVKTIEKTVFLTFDDGPTTDVTDWVLDILKERDVNATFFCLGKNVAQNKVLYQRIIDENHAVGNHTYQHLNGYSSKKADYTNDVLQAQQFVKSNLFRPPYGKLNFSNFLQVKKMGFKIVMWDQLSYDWDGQISREEILKQLIKNTKSGSIVVFHDSTKAYTNLSYVLPLYLDWLKKNHFICKSLTF